MVTGSSDQMVKVWLYNEGVPTHVGTGHAGVVTNVKVSPDGQFVVSTSVDGGIFLWRFPRDGDDDTAATTAPATGAGGSVNRLSSNSRRDVVGERDGSSSSREQQTARSRQLSQKKSIPARVENINVISKAQKVHSNTDSAAAGGDSNNAAAAAAPPSAKSGGDKSSGCGGKEPPQPVASGSVKCLCRRGTTCNCGDGAAASGAGRKSAATGHV